MILYVCYLTGSITPEGFFVSMCDYLELWDKLSLLQKENLKDRYLLGCSCMVIHYVMYLLHYIYI